MNNKKPVSITLTEKDRRKVDALAEAAGVNRSDMIRTLIRSRRKPYRARTPKPAKMFSAGKIPEYETLLEALSE